MKARHVSAALLLTLPLTAQEAPSFHRDVLPIFRAHCTGCHQPAKSKGEVVLTNHAGATAELDGVALVLPSDPDASLLLEVVTSQDGAPPSMPEDADPLTAAEVDVLRRWIAAGATDDSPTSTASPEAPKSYARAPVISALAWSPDGRLLAVPGRHEILLHHTDGSGIAARLGGLSERIQSLAFSPDGSLLAAAGGSPARFGEVQIWEMSKRRLLTSKIVTSDTLFGASWSPDGSRVAFGATDTAVRAIEARSGRDVLFSGAHDDWVLDTCWSTDGSHLTTVSRDRSLKLIKVESQQFIDNITSITPGALKGGLITIDRHPTRDELLVGGADGTPKTYRTYREKARKIGDDYNRLKTFRQMDGRVFDVQYFADGKRLAAAGSLAGSGTVRVYDAEGKLIWSHDALAGIYALAVSPDGRRIAAAGFSGVVEILDATNGWLEHAFVPVPLRPASTASTTSTESTSG